MNCECKPMPHIETCSWCLNQEIEKLEARLAEKEKRITFLADKASENYQLAVEAQEESELKDSWVKHHQGSVEATMRKLAESQKEFSACHLTKNILRDTHEKLEEKFSEALGILRMLENFEQWTIANVIGQSQDFRDTTQYKRAKEFLAKHEIKGSENEQRD